MSRPTPAEAIEPVLPELAPGFAMETAEAALRALTAAGYMVVTQEAVMPGWRMASNVQTMVDPYRAAKAPRIVQDASGAAGGSTTTDKPPQATQSSYWTSMLTKVELKGSPSFAVACTDSPLGIDFVRLRSGQAVLDVRRDELLDPDQARQAAARLERLTWPAPAPGTHESDLLHIKTPWHDKTYGGDIDFDEHIEYGRARAWSVSRKEPR